MKQIINGTYAVSTDIDLHYSPDDNGWYFQDYKLDRVSVLYKTKNDAVRAMKLNNIVWEG